MKCLELDKEFKSRNEMFAALKSNEDKIISLKKAAVYKSADKGQLAPCNTFMKLPDETKAALNLKEDHIYPIINTTLYLDSHNDVHANGIWSKSLSEQKGQINYVLDHSLKISDVIAWADDVKAFTRSVSWAFVGKNFEGETQALIYEIPKDAIVSQDASKVIDEKRKVQNSVRMQYVKIELAMDSERKEDKENKKLWNKTIDKIANKEIAQEQGYYFWVSEAKIIKEGSMVLYGSNDATPIIYEPSSTQTEPQKDQDTQEIINYIKSLKWKK